MKRRFLFLWTAVAVLAFAAGARAGIIQTTPDDFAVLTGGYLSVDRSTSITGTVGAVGGGWIDREVVMTGDVYSGSGLGTGRNVTIGGGLVSAGDVWLDRGASVASIDGSRNVGIGRGVNVDGYVAAGRRVGIDRDTVVRGDVSYGTGQWISGSATVGGTVGQGLREVRTWQTTLPDEPAWGGAGGSAYHGRGDDVILDPDTYGSLNVDRDATVHLSAGTYDFGSIWLGSGTEIVADTSAGDVVLNLSGSLSTDAEVSFTRSGGGDLLIQADGFIYLGRGTQADGAFTSFRSLGVDAGSSIIGRLQSTGNLWIGRDSTLTGPLTGGAVPEPATLAFLAGGVMAVLTRRWMRPA